MPALLSLHRLASFLCRAWHCGRGLLAVALLLVISSAQAGSKDFITERGWWEDPSGQMGWAEAARQTFEPYQGVLSQGYGSGVIWLRVRLTPQTDGTHSLDGNRLMLRIRPVYLDNIQVFDPLVTGGLVGVSGDRTHPRSEAFPSLSFLMPLERGDRPRDIFLRVQTHSTRQIAVEVLSMEELLRQEQGQQFVTSLYLGLILILMFWGLAHWLFTREAVMGAFGLKQLAAWVYALSALGYARVYWPTHWPAHWLDGTTSLFSVLAVSAAIYFHLLLIREFDPHPWLARLHALMLGLLPVKLLLLFGTDMTSLALRINMTEVLVAPFLFFVSVCRARGWQKEHRSAQPQIGRAVVIGFYGMLVVILLAASLPGLGLSEGGEIALYLAQVHGLVTAFLIMLMLQYRNHVRQKQQRETLIALERSQIQAKQERAVREDQQKLLAMLAHELKTPLATLQMRVHHDTPGSHAMRRAIRDMNGVIERCLQMAQWGDRQLQAQLEPVDLASVVEEAVAACAQPDRVDIQGPMDRAFQTDRQLLFIVLSNLLENACKYSAPDSPITLQSVPGRASVTLEVSNWPGTAGWPEPTHLFEKYHRGLQARRQAGTGLGLYLTRHLMEILGGSVSYQPDPQCIRFVLSFPANRHPK